MTTPSRPRNDLYLKGLKTTNNKRDVLAADLKGLTNGEVNGAAKMATAAWIQTASDMELDICLTLSKEEFIDAVKAKGPTTQVNTEKKRLSLEEINENKKLHGIFYSKWLARANPSYQTPEDQHSVTSGVMVVVASAVIIGAAHSVKQSFRVFQFWRYRGPKTQMVDGKEYPTSLYAKRRTAAGFDDKPLVTPETLRASDLFGLPWFLCGSIFSVASGLRIITKQFKRSTFTKTPNAPPTNTFDTATKATNTTTKAADTATKATNTSTKATDTATKATNTTPPTGTSSK
ncbi:nucleoid DNA-binding protein [Planoprotostelium fungivorum]|uniref:Nucleoid DNA-binding protein n=1 Tax=Planoprotostelium fungivorum TaxID=1890364 RepID=A0A2P6MNM5_9EUKA|nr:nucleoid DNA-binding protein [Planoprotostelium fungivorum]